MKGNNVKNRVPPRAVRYGTQFSVVVAPVAKGDLAALGHPSIFRPEHQIRETQGTAKKSQYQRGAAKSSRCCQANDPLDSDDSALSGVVRLHCRMKWSDVFYDWR